MQHFSIIIPTLNEAGNILPLLRRIRLVALRHGLEPEILFVDDGSSDGTRERIEAYQGPLQVGLIRRDNERGLTGAVVAGARAAANDWIVVMDSDLSHPPESIPALLAPLADGSRDMVIGSRYTPGGGTPGWPLFRRTASHLAALPARLLTGVHDPLAGFFAVRRNDLAGVSRDLSGFKVGLEVIVRGGSDFRVGEVPITFHDRSCGRSKMTMAILGRYLRQLLRLFLDRAGIRHILPIAMTAVLAGLLDASLFRLSTTLGYPLDTGHMASFLIAASFGYCLTALIVPGPGHGPTAKGFFRFATCILMLLGLRGGILALWLPQSSPPSLPLLVLLAATTCLGLPLALWISRFRPERLDWRLFGSLLIAYTILLRLLYLGGIELLQEEAYYWNYSQHMAAGYLDHPPMVALLIRFGTLLFGTTEAGVRFGAFICWFITAFFIYRFARTMLDREAAFGTLILVAVLPVFFGMALVMTPDAPLLACWAASIYHLYRALLQEQRQDWYKAGIWLGAGLASKYTIAFLGPATILFMLLDSSSRKWFLRPQPYLAALLALALFSPVVWWNYQHDWASFLFQSRERLQQAALFSTDRLLVSILILLTPTGVLAAAHCLRPKLVRLAFPHTTPGDIRRRSYLFVLTMVVIPLAIFVMFSLTSETKLNWTGPLWLALLPFMAQAMIKHRNVSRGLVPRLWPATLTVLVMGYGILLLYGAIGLPGIPYGGSAFLFGWEDLAQQVETKVRTTAAQEGARPLVAGMDRYRIASGLAFYRSKHTREKDAAPAVDETTGRQLFGYSALMYEYWHPPALASDRDILVISKNREQLSPELFRNRYRQLGKIGEITVTKQGKKAGHYYYRLLTWHSPDIAASGADSFTRSKAANRLPEEAQLPENTASPVTGAL